MISFRKATENDITLIGELAEKSWNASYIGIISQDQVEYMLRLMYSPKVISGHLQNSNYHYYIILFNEIPAGFIGFENHYEKNTTKLHRIYLLQEFKGQGLGKAGLTFLKKQVKQVSDKRIILNVNKANHAKKVYESQGFKIYETGIFDIGNGFVMDDYLMEYFLEK